MRNAISIRASFGRDKEGFWVAHIEQLPIEGERTYNPSFSTRHTLPVPASATHEQAQEAFYELLNREMRRYGH